ncbi:helix-turn-helix transcriptional regulator [Pseudahrensia aquimaris]|uniref:Helix-turn-helix transcriptional regulator n=1 Tax=Pseudahrensia aquimaris TaxID=744461 RepID=A0ABW3FF30_9HYPH
MTQPSSTDLTSSNDRLVTRKEAAAFLGFTPKTLANWASSGEGPDFILIRNRARYKISNLYRWIEEKGKDGINLAA